MNNTKLEFFLNSSNTKFIKNHTLSYDTYFKMGGEADYFILPINQEELVSLIDFLIKEELKYKLIGATSNILFLNELNYGIIISTKLLTNVFISNVDNTVEVSSGYSLSDFTRLMLLNGFEGFEGLEGIPGTIGGGIVMNAGAYGYEISQYIESVKIINDNGKVINLTKDECNFEFRNSIFKGLSKFIILSAKFKCVCGKRDSIANKMEIYHIARHSYQEFSYPNLGSFYSVKGDIYKDFYKNNKLLYVFIKLAIKNPLTKFIMRKRPSNYFLNKMAIKYNENITYPLSHKSINILVNNGLVKYEDIEKHILNMSKIYNNYSIENEIITTNLSEKQSNK
ncbi:UDP-N-acetylenolpyruvoylglucosamine reductase [Photobacterium malacitanum]|uniref:UDP-N-acetylenolpyruvoylglucosamine reductase n=1 Tax=Photobacterium malacitanum TaxID=2204294 RepID=A0A1Y6MGF2_9GAMM|nr:FAD-binding protein [Photobacterium malacitanum]SMY35614.1 UDP-N-acetylenolpyruvoylglucosamine reductase [Photobacterium malacitanum]